MYADRCYNDYTSRVLYDKKTLAPGEKPKHWRGLAKIYYSEYKKTGFDFNDEYYTMVEPTEASRVGLILSVAIGADERPLAATYESNFYNGKDEIMRVYELAAGDRFTVSANGFTGTPKVGAIVEADGYDLKIADTASTHAFHGEIIEEIKRTGGTFYKVLVRKNG